MSTEEDWKDRKGVRRILLSMVLLAEFLKRTKGDTSSDLPDDTVVIDVFRTDEDRLKAGGVFSVLVESSEWPPLWEGMIVPIIVVRTTTVTGHPER